MCVRFCAQEGFYARKKRFRAQSAQIMGPSLSGATGLLRACRGPRHPRGFYYGSIQACSAEFYPDQIARIVLAADGPTLIGIRCRML